MMRWTMVVWGILLLGLAGCGSTSSPSPSATSTAGARANVCQRLTTINQSLITLSNIGENTTVGEVKSLQAKISTALTGIDKLIPGDMGPTLSNLQSANYQLSEAIEDYPDNATIGQTSTRLEGFKGHVAKAQAATAKLTSGLKCP